MKKYLCLIATTICLPFLSHAQQAHRLLQNWIVETSPGNAGAKDYYFLVMPDNTVDSFSAGNLPRPFPGIDNVAAIDAGAHHVVALKKDGTVWTWGYNLKAVFAPVQVPGITTAIAVSANYSGSYALLSDGTVWQWGSQIGQKGKAPVQVRGIANAIALAGNTALLKDGTVMTWGNGTRGQLGNGANKSSETPVQVSGIKNAVSIGSDREEFNLALLADGTVWGWGYNAKGQLGTYKMGLDENSYSSLPVQIKGLENVVAISAEATCLALTKDGTVKAWGWGAIGGMGSGHPGGNDANPVPKKVPIPTNVIGIYSNKSTGLAMLSDGTLWGWGADVVATGVYHQSWKPVMMGKVGEYKR